MPLSNSNINPSQNYKVTASFTASAASNTVLTGYILLNQTDTTGTQTTTVPPNQVWKVVDSFVSATQSPDCLADLWIDNTPQNINWDLNASSLALGTTRINPFAYMVNGGLIVGATSSVQVKLASQTATNSNGQTVTLTLVVVQYPIQGK